jgi:hypothetical protein
MANLAPLFSCLDHSTDTLPSIYLFHTSETAKLPYHLLCASLYANANAKLLDYVCTAYKRNRKSAQIYNLSIALKFLETWGPFA